MCLCWSVIAVVTELSCFALRLCSWMTSPHTNSSVSCASHVTAPTSALKLEYKQEVVHEAPKKLQMRQQQHAGCSQRDPGVKDGSQHIFIHIYIKQRESFLLQLFSFQCSLSFKVILCWVWLLLLVIKRYSKSTLFLPNPWCPERSRAYHNKMIIIKGNDR